MDKPNAELAARAQQAGLGAFRCYFPFAAKNRNRLLGKVVIATLLACLLFVGTVAGAAGWIDFKFYYPIAMLGAAGWWVYAVYALYKGLKCRVQVHELGLVHSDHKQTDVVPWIDVVSVSMNVTEYVGDENYYEGYFDISIRTDGHGTAHHSQSRELQIPAEFENVERLMQELNRVTDIGRSLRKRLDPERGMSHLVSGDQDLYAYTEDLAISPMSWEDDWGPLARLQTAEQRLTHHFYAQALFSAFNAAAKVSLWLDALQSLGYQGAGSFFRAYVTLLKYYGVAGGNPDELETRTWGELAARCEEAAISRLNEDIAAGHQRLPAPATPRELDELGRNMLRQTDHPRRASSAQIAA